MKILLTGASLIAATGVFLASIASAESALYQWTDDAGQRVYGENPPSGVKATPVTNDADALSQEEEALEEEDRMRAMTWEEEVSGLREEPPQ